MARAIPTAVVPVVPCLPGLQVAGLVAGAAVVAAAAVWLGIEVPATVAVVGEVDAAGERVGDVGDGDGADALTLLKLSEANGITLLVVPSSSKSGREVAALRDRRAKLHAGIRVVAVRTLVEALDQVLPAAEPGAVLESG